MIKTKTIKELVDEGLTQSRAFVKTFNWKQFLNRWFLGALSLSFVFCFVFLITLISRYVSISYVRHEVLRLQNSLEDSEWDIAYEDLALNLWWPMPLMTVNNVKIYSRQEPRREWNIKSIKLESGMANSHVIRLKLSPQQNLVIGEQQYDIDFPSAPMEIYFDEKRGVKQLLFAAKNINIEDYATISEINFGLQQMVSHQINDNFPFLEIHAEVKKIAFDPSLNWPLSQNLNKMYAHIIQKGRIKSKRTYQDSISDWFLSGGHFDVSQMTLDWDPLLIVGKGNVTFNDNMEPHVRLTTSSQALIPTIDIWEEKGVFERKGVFVSRILLKNKAFKVNPNDKYDTIMTPIDYRKKQVLIENIPVMTFK